MYDSDIRKEKYFEMGKREKRTADPDYHCIYGDSTDVVVRVHLSPVLRNGKIQLLQDEVHDTCR